MKEIVIKILKNKNLNKIFYKKHSMFEQHFTNDQQFVARSKGFTTINKDDYLTLKNVNLSNEDFSGKKLRDFVAINSRFNHCKFENMVLKQACFGGGHTQTEYIDCSFDNSKITATAAGNARFVRCSFRNVVLEELFAHNIEFVDCVFSGKLKKSVFFGKVSKENQKTLGRAINKFHGNDFSGMEFDDIGFRDGIDLSKQKLPVGDEYIYLQNAPAVVEQLKHEIMNWEDTKLKKDALVLIKIFERRIENGQKQLFLKVDDLKDNFPEEIISLIQKIGDID